MPRLSYSATSVNFTHFWSPNQATKLLPIVDKLVVPWYVFLKRFWPGVHCHCISTVISGYLFLFPPKSDRIVWLCNRRISCLLPNLPPHTPHGITYQVPSAGPPQKVLWKSIADSFGPIMCLPAPKKSGTSFQIPTENKIKTDSSTFDHY